MDDSAVKRGRTQKDFVEAVSDQLRWLLPAKQVSVSTLIEYRVHKAMNRLRRRGLFEPSIVLAPMGDECQPEFHEQQFLHLTLRPWLEIAH